MKYSAYTVTGALSAILLLTACSGGEDATSSSATGEVSASTQISEEQGLAGLASLNLSEPGDLTWDNRTFAEGVFTFSGLVFSPEGADEGEELNIAELNVAAPRVDDAGNVLIDQIEAIGFSLDENGSVMSLDRIIVDQPGPGLSALIADMLNDQVEEGFSYESEDPSDFYFNAMSLTGLSFVDVEEDMEFGLGEVSFNQYDENGIASVVMAGLRLNGTEDGNPVSIQLTEMRMDGLGNTLTDFYDDIFRNMDNPDNINFPSFADPAQLMDSAVIRGLVVNAGGMNIDMPEMTMSVEEQGNNAVATSAMPRLAVSYGEGEVGAQVAQGFEMLGYEEMVFSFESNAVYEDGGDRIRTTGDNYFQLEDGVRIDFSQDISGYSDYMEAYMAAMSEMMGDAASGDMDAVENMNNPLNEQLMAAYGELDINSFSMSIVDQSLLERALGAAGQAQGMDAEQMRVQAAGMVGMLGMMAPPEIPPALMTQLTGSLSGFIQNGGSVTFAMDPDSPVSMATLIEAGESGEFDLEALGITISHEAP